MASEAIKPWNCTMNFLLKCLLLTEKMKFFPLNDDSRIYKTSKRHGGGWHGRTK